MQHDNPMTFACNARMGVIRAVGAWF